MPTSLNCPNCNAPLNFSDHPNQVSIHCDYCNSTIIVPEEERSTINAPHSNNPQEAQIMAEVTQLIQNGRKIEAIKLFRETFGVNLKEAKEVVEAMARYETVHFANSTFTAQIQPGTIQTSGSWLGGCVWRFIVFGFFFALVIVIVGIFETRAGNSNQQIETAVEQINELLGSDVIPSGGDIEITIDEELERTIELIEDNVNLTGFPEPDLQIGGAEGTGPGFFNDTRQIAIDGEGLIYTADYDGGRIQVFNEEGEFIRQLNLEADKFIPSMVVNRQGTLLVQAPQGIEKYDSQTGEFLGLVPNSERLGFLPGMTITLDGSLVVAGRDRLMRYDSDENIMLDIPNLDEIIPEYETATTDVAVDGSGNIYIMGRETIYKLDANGRFLDRIGSRGESEDQFISFPTAITVDGRGYVYATDFSGIRVFDENGRFLTNIPMSGVIFDMLITTQDELIVMDRNGNELRQYALADLLP
ncbi:MAG: hypothetical protein AAF490_25375 [Chloroflexota bacterium]